MCSHSNLGKLSRREFLTLGGTASLGLAPSARGAMPTPSAQAAPVDTPPAPTFRSGEVQLESTA